MQARMLSALFMVPAWFVKRSPNVPGTASQFESRAAVPVPVVVAASQNWDGNDGPWSSFPLQIGTPSQDVRVLVSTSSYQMLPVLPGGCIATDPSNCETLQGQFFQPNASSTWQVNEDDLTSNVYPRLIDEQLGYTANGGLGFDDVTVGWQGSGGPTLLNQTIAAFEDKDFYVGYFGISPRASNFSNFDNPIPSYMQDLKNQSVIPSISWSYTAGNQYRFDQVFASLVLGGYDSSKFIPNDVTFKFPSDDRDLTVQLETVTASDDKTMDTPLLPNAISTFVDSSLPYIWLPVEACVLFEDAFGLVWDNNTELYLLNSSHQAALRAQNADITFTLGNFTAGAIANIILPYAAFDLTVSSPIVGNSTPYFPLKRAANSTQYTLGRIFFQEAYITADYERGNFSVSQCSWVPGAQQHLVAIAPPSNATSTHSSGTSNKISVGLLVGGIVGGVILLTVIGFSILHFYIMPRRRKVTTAKSAETEQVVTSPPPTKDDSTHQIFDLNTSGSPEVAEMADATVIQRPVETDGNALRQLQSEIDGSSTRRIHELEIDNILHFAEVDGSELHEMPAREEVVAEMMDQSGESIEPSLRPE